MSALSYVWGEADPVPTLPAGWVYDRSAGNWLFVVSPEGARFYLAANGALLGVVPARRAGAEDVATAREAGGSLQEGELIADATMWQPLEGLLPAAGGCPPAVQRKVVEVGGLEVQVWEFFEGDFGFAVAGEETRNFASAMLAESGGRKEAVAILLRQGGDLAA